METINGKEEEEGGGGRENSVYTVQYSTARMYVPLFEAFNAVSEGCVNITYVACCKKKYSESQGKHFAVLATRLYCNFCYKQNIAW